MEPTSVQALCNVLVRSRLMSADEVRALFRRWQGEAKQADNVDKFTQWLVD